MPRSVAGCDARKVALADGTQDATHSGMARSRAMVRPRPTAEARGTVRIDEECLELDVESAHDIDVLRSWLGRVNGPAYPQPYLVEGPPGRFRLYVGEAAERVRTQHGIL